MKIFKILLLLLPFFSFSQKKFESVRKQLIESKKYEYVYDFENNYAVFRTFKGKMGLLDSTGNVVIKPNFDYIHNISDLKNLFEVGNTINKKYKRGFIDLQGNYKIPLEYDDIFYLHNNLIRATKSNKTGVINTENNIILPLKYDYIMEQNGILFVQLKNEIDIFDSNGKTLTHFLAKDIEYFTEGKSIVTLQNNTTLIIDNQGKTVLEPIKNHQFEKIIDSDSFLIRNTLTNKKGIVNLVGQYKVASNYDDISLSKSIYIVKNKGKYGCISRNDSLLKPIIYDFIYAVNYTDSISFKNHYFAQKENLKGILNPFLEKDILPFQYKNIQNFSDFYVVENSENKNGLFSENGEKIIDEKYEFFSGFGNKIFAVKEGKKYLLTIQNKNYSEVEIPVDHFVKNWFSVFGITKSNYQIFKNKDKFGVLSNENKVVIPCEYDKIENIYLSNEFIVLKNKKYGVVNAKNEILLPLKYDTFQMMKESICFEIKNTKEKKYYAKNFVAQ